MTNHQVVGGLIVAMVLAICGALVAWAWSADNGRGNDPGTAPPPAGTPTSMPGDPTPGPSADESHIRPSGSAKIPDAYPADVHCKGEVRVPGQGWDIDHYCNDREFSAEELIFSDGKLFSSRKDGVPPMPWWRANLGSSPNKRQCESVMNQRPGAFDLSATKAGESFCMRTTEDRVAYFRWNATQNGQPMVSFIVWKGGRG